MLGWVARLKSSMAASSGIILSDIKVLLSYLVCNLTDNSNASWFIGMHTNARAKKRTMGGHMVKRIRGQGIATFATFI